MSANLQRVLLSAARLQQLVPDAVLVGDSVATIYAGHRESLDHDHFLGDLADRYLEVLDAVEASDGWATSVWGPRPPVMILGSLDGVEAGLRQLRRTRPMETCLVEVAPGVDVTVPTEEETLRIKAYLVVQRNAVRDYLDVVALAEHLGQDAASALLRGLDDYYSDRSEEEGSVRTALALALADPQPRDAEVITELPRYKGLAERWHDWADVVAACQGLAAALAEETR